MTKKSEPIRTCVGCRQRHPSQVLIRIRLDGDVLVDAADATGTGGRGAWLCRETLGSCIASAVKTHAFARAFRQRIPSEVVDAFVDGFPAPRND